MANDGIEQELAQAERASQAGLRDQARGHFEAVLAIDEGEPTARNWLGADALERADAAAAAVHFEIASRREPGERSHWLNLAAAHRILDQSEREREAIEKALAIDQTDLLALVRISELHERLGEDVSAAERWTAVLALSSNIRDPSPEFADILTHAKHYVAQQQRTFASAVDSALAAELAAATARDRRMRGWAGGRSTPTIAKGCITRFCQRMNFSTPTIFPG
ncbi:MAG: hypothetical protein H0W71_06100 [Sphingomonas sp.]|nr:hypothetical protein [Sphingomonas sp.]